ncbi:MULTISPECIES: hypothetical protein [unclassified Mesorhizobium]|uniref:hypothetical protein n=1 Tax=unclassified Mesorhizobium TaxID=325217 RepID=UPI003334F5F4
MTNAFSLADLTDMTHSKRRSVQLWAEAGVILADESTERAGTGTHRRFSRDEAIIACLVAGLTRHFHMPIGVLLQVSDGIRREQFQSMIDGAMKNGRPCFLVIRPEEVGIGHFQISIVSGADDKNAFDALTKTLIRARSAALAVLRVNDHLAQLWSK